MSEHSFDYRRVGAMPGKATKGVQILHRLNQATATACAALDDAKEAISRFDNLPKQEQEVAAKAFPTGDLVSTAKAMVLASERPEQKPKKN